MDENTDLSPIGTVLLSRYASQAHFLGTSAFLSRAHQQTLLQRDFFTNPSLPPLLVREPGVLSAQSQVLVPTLKLCYKYFSGDRIDKLLQVVGTNTNKNERPKNHPRGSTTLIFCGTVEQATEVFAALEQQREHGRRRETTTIHLLHQELDPDELRRLVASLRTNTSWDGGDTLLVATDIAARGLDIPNIHHVILVQVPVTVSSFVHQVGRTARQGQTGLLTALVHTASGDAQKYKHLHALKGATQLF
jgi:superfamily II DNA/RNA helicase